jgi:hypothetical protein
MSGISKLFWARIELLFSHNLLMCVNILVNEPSYKHFEVQHKFNGQFNYRNILCVRRNFRCVEFVSRNFNELLTTSRKWYCVRDCKHCHTMRYWEETGIK